MTRAACLVLLLLAGAAEALDVRVEPYQEARRAGALGAVGGRVVEEPRTPRGPARALAGTTVILLPRSEALLATLERLKAQSRESAPAFTAAAPAMRKAREAYERELWEAGAPDLTPTLVVDGAGGFRIDEVPAGNWLLVGWHTVRFDTSGMKTPGRERDQFQVAPRVRGYESVTIWIREIAVAGGETATVELTDRNGWFRGVVEERVLDTGR